MEESGRRWTKKLWTMVDGVDKSLNFGLEEFVYLFAVWGTFRKRRLKPAISKV
jgi:hypothetical protein